MKTWLPIPPVLVLAAALALPAMPFAPALAQEAPMVVAQQERPSLFRFLFGSRDRQQQRPAPPPGYRYPAVPPPQRAAPPAPAAPQQARRAPARAQPSPEPQPVQPVEKAADAKRVLVVGDFMARALARGLTQAYAEDPSVAVIEAVSGSSGLVRDDYYDWRAELPKIIEEQKPDAILVMIGANDRQPLNTPQGTATLRSDAWVQAYGERIAAIRDIVKASGKPGLWAGLVPVRSNSMSRDYSAFNGLYRERLQGSGLQLIDMWNGFADEEGRYADHGPDISGQQARLRIDDGIGFTRTGQRKLAFFVEGPLARLLQDEPGARVAALPGEAPPDLEGVQAPAMTDLEEEQAAPAMAAAAPRIGPLVPIEALADRDGRLSTLSRAPGAAADLVVGGGIGQGAPAAAPPPGRADNFAWPR